MSYGFLLQKKAYFKRAIPWLRQFLLNDLYYFFIIHNHTMCKWYLLIVASCCCLFIDSQAQPINSPADGSKKVPCEITKSYDSLQIDATIDTVLVHAVTVTVSFTNHSVRPFTLYKPLLPGAVLQDNVFVVYNLNDSLAIYKGSRINNYLCHDSILLTVKPVLSSTNLLEIKPGQTLTFQTNLSEFYNLKEIIHAGMNECWLAYHAMMPAIVNGKQLREKDGRTKKMKPVYYSLTFSGKDVDEKRRNFVIID